MVSVNAIQGTLIADNAITAVHIATNAVSGTLIADNAVTATHIAQNTITVTQLADDAVEADKIADGVITTNHLNKAMISSQTQVTAVAGDFLLIGDTSDSNNLKKIPISGITSLVSSFDADAAQTFNDSGAAVDFRVEGDTEQNLFFVDGSADKVGIGTNSPSTLLHLGGTAPGDSIIRQDSTSSGTNWEIGERAAGKWQIFEDDNDSIVATFKSDGKVGIGTESPDSVLQVKSTGGGSELAFKITDNSGNSVYEQQGGGRAIFQYGPMLVAASTDIMHANMDDLQVGNAVGNRGLTVASGNGSYGTLAFADGSSGNEAYRGFVEYYHNDDSMRLGSGGVERIRVADNGKIIHKSYGSGDNIMTFIETQNSSDTGIALGRNGTNNLKTGLRSSSNGSSSIFQIKLSLGESEGTQSISSPQFQFYHNGNLAITGSYSSDRRLKENIVNIPDGSTAFIKQLNPVSFNMIGSTVTKAGFIAQEVEALKPSLINGGEVDEQGDEIMRGVDYFGILAHAVKTIQELEARIATLEG